MHQPASGPRFVHATIPAPYFEPKPARPPRVRSIPSTNLTRRPTSYPTNAAIFTAVDLEMTGLDCDPMTATELDT